MVCSCETIQFEQWFLWDEFQTGKSFTPQHVVVVVIMNQGGKAFRHWMFCSLIICAPHGMVVVPVPWE